MQKTLIQVQSLSKNFNGKDIINDINFEIYANSIVALLGINGAGKTTLINMLLGLERPTVGLIHMNGLEPSNPYARKNLGVVLQVSEFIEVLTPAEMLAFVAQHYPAPKSCEEVIESFALQDFLNKRIRVLSQGQKRRLALALAFIGNPRIIFLDEPSVGLDMQSRLKLWRYLKNYPRENGVIVLTTHYIEEAQCLADRILVLHEGKIHADSTVADIQRQFSNDNLEDIFFQLVGGGSMLKLIFVYTAFYVTELMRNVSALFFTLLFPAMLFLLFGGHHDDAFARLCHYAVYCNFAVQTVMLQGLGISLTAAEHSAWNLQSRTLPVSMVPSVVGRILSSLIFSLISIAFVMSVNVWQHDVALTLYQQCVILTIALVGGVPMGLLAILMSKHLSAAGARAAFIMLNTLLLFCAFSLPTPGDLGFLLQLVPSTQWMMLSVAALTKEFIWPHVFWLLTYTLLFGMLIGMTQEHSD